jgi:hypothetical protein
VLGFNVSLAGFEPATLSGQRSKRCAYSSSATGTKEGKVKYYLPRIRPLLSNNNGKQEIFRFPEGYFELKYRKTKIFILIL